jgi:hypothetical protein
MFSRITVMPDSEIQEYKDALREMANRAFVEEQLRGGNRTEDIIKRLVDRGVSFSKLTNT